MIWWISYYILHAPWLNSNTPFDRVNDEISLIKGHVLTLTRLFFAHWHKSGLFIIWLNVLNTIYIIQYPIVTFNYVKYTVLVHQHERWWLHVYVYLFFCLSIILHIIFRAGDVIPKDILDFLVTASRDIVIFTKVNDKILIHYDQHKIIIWIYLKRT